MRNKVYGYVAAIAPSKPIAHSTSSDSKGTNGLALAQTCRQIRSEYDLIAKRIAKVFKVKWHELPMFFEIFYPDAQSRQNPPTKLFVLFDKAIGRENPYIDILPILQMMANDPSFACSFDMDPDTKWTVNGYEYQAGAVRACWYITRFTKAKGVVWWNDIRRGAVQQVFVKQCGSGISFDSSFGGTIIVAYFDRSLVPPEVTDDHYLRHLDMGKTWHTHFRSVFRSVFKSVLN